MQLAWKTIGIGVSQTTTYMQVNSSHNVASACHNNEYVQSRVKLSHARIQGLAVITLLSANTDTFIIRHNSNTQCQRLKISITHTWVGTLTAIANFGKFHQQMLQ